MGGSDGCKGRRRPSSTPPKWVRTSFILSNMFCMMVLNRKKLLNKKTYWQFLRYNTFVYYFSYIQVLVWLTPGWNWNSHGKQVILSWKSHGKVMEFFYQNCVGTLKLLYPIFEILQISKLLYSKVCSFWDKTCMVTLKSRSSHYLLLNRIEIEVRSVGIC